MQYAKVVNNEVVRVGRLPNSFETSQLGVILNFHLLSDAKLKTYGFYPIVDNTPAFDGRYVSKTTPAYTVGVDAVVLTHALKTKDILAYKQKVIAAVYTKAKTLLDLQASGYSFAEIATWPAIQADVVAYNATTVVGAALQAAADASAYDVAGIAALLTPRIAVQASILANRKALVEAINAAVDLQAVADVDITVGW